MWFEEDGSGVPGGRGVPETRERLPAARIYGYQQIVEVRSHMMSDNTKGMSCILDVVTVVRKKSDQHKKRPTQR